MKRTVCRARRATRSSGAPKRILVEVGDRVQVRANGGSPAARKYAGEKGRVTTISPGFDGIVFDVRVEGNNFDIVLVEGDLSPEEGEPIFVDLLSGLEAQSELNRLLDELFDENS